MKKFNVKKLLIGVLASANVWAVTATSIKKVKAPTVNPEPPIVNPGGQTLSKEEQLIKIKTMTLKVLKHNSVMDIEDITLLDFKNNKMTAYCTLKNDKISTVVASFNLESENNSSSLIKALSKVNNVNLVETKHCNDNVFMHDFAVKYFYACDEFDKENYELLNAFQNDSIKTIIGITCMEQRLYKFSYIVKNKTTNQVSKLDHQVIFAMPNWNQFSLMLEDGKFENLYDYLLSRKSAASHTQTTNFSNFASNYIKYLGSNNLTSLLDQLTAEEKEDIAKQQFLNSIEKKTINKLKENGLENLQFITTGKLDDKTTSYYESNDLASLVTYSIDGNKYFAKIYNNIIPYTPQSYLNLVDYSDNTTAEKNLYINAFELEENNFAAQVFDKYYDGKLPQYDLCYTSKIQYLDNESILKKYAKINCLYLWEDENGNYTYYNATLRFDRATEDELNSYFENNPTKNEYDYYYEKFKNNDFARGTEVNYINKIDTNTKNFKEELYEGVLNYLRSQEGRKNAEILLIDYKRSPNYTIYDEFNLFVVYKHTQDGIEYINTAKASIPCKLENSSNVDEIIKNLKSKDFAPFPFDYNPFRYSSNDQVLNACKPVSKEALYYQDKIYNRIQQTLHFATYNKEVIARYMTDIDKVSDHDSTYLSLSLVIIAKDRNTGKYSYYNFNPKYKYNQEEFDAYIASNQGSTLLDYYFYKMDIYEKNNPSRISEEWYAFTYEFSNFTNRFTRNIENDNVKYLNVKQYLASKNNVTTIKPKKEDDNQLSM